MLPHSHYFNDHHRVVLLLSILVRWGVCSHSPVSVWFYFSLEATSSPKTITDVVDWKNPSIECHQVSHTIVICTTQKSTLSCLFFFCIFDLFSIHFQLSFRLARLIHKGLCEINLLQSPSIDCLLEYFKNFFI